MLYTMCILNCRSDEWVLKGISGYIYGLYLKKTFGVNEYRHWIKEVYRTVVIKGEIMPKHQLFKC